MTLRQFNKQLYVKNLSRARNMEAAVRRYVTIIVLGPPKSYNLFKILILTLKFSN